MHPHICVLAGTCLIMILLHARIPLDQCSASPGAEMRMKVSWILPLKVRCVMPSHRDAL